MVSKPRTAVARITRPALISSACRAASARTPPPDRRCVAWSTEPPHSRGSDRLAAAAPMDRRTGSGSRPGSRNDDRLNAAAMTGMTLAVWADLKPDATFIHDPDGKTTTFGEVNANANRIVRLLRQHGLKAGDAVALVCSNRAEFVVVLAAAQRGGWRITPVNWHLTAAEIAYIVDDCEAKAVFCEARVAASAAAVAQCPGVKVKVAIGGPIESFADYAAALAPLDG